MATFGFEAQGALVLGFDLGAFGFVGSCAPIWISDMLEAIRACEARDDGGRVLLLLVSLIVLAAVMVAIGMTCQVSDVLIESRQMRRLATLHGLQAFFFNLGVLALTINALSGASQPSDLRWE